MKIIEIFNPVEGERGPFSISIEENEWKDCVSIEIGDKQVFIQDVELHKLADMIGIIQERRGGSKRRG